MIVDIYNQIDSMVTDPARADGATFRYNGTAYSVREVHTSDGMVTGLRCRKFDVDLRRWYDREVTLSKQEAIDAAASSYFPLDSYSLYNTSGTEGPAALFRRRAASYSRQISPATIVAHSVILRTDDSNLDLGNSNLITDYALALAILGIYPTFIASMYTAATRRGSYTVAVAPTMMLSGCSKVDNDLYTVYVGTRNTASSNPTRYIGSFVRVNTTAKTIGVSQDKPAVYSALYTYFSSLPESHADYGYNVIKYNGA